MMADADTDPRLLIGEVARRVGVSPGLLRAWERRYGFLQPARTPTGHRLYSHEDEQRVRAMVQMVNTGVSPNQAARALPAPRINSGAHTSSRSPDAERDALAEVLDRFDETAGQAVFDRLMSEYALPTLLTNVVLPYLHELGSRWARGEVTVSQEHFASNLIRARLLGLARGWDAGGGKRALLACPAGERHDIGLIAFGLALRAQGWRITYVGSDTPTESLTHSTAQLGPDALVLAVSDAERLAQIPAGLAPPGVRIAIGGPGASSGEADRLHAILLASDPFQAAVQLAAT